jgi:hypothetical protein
LAVIQAFPIASARPDLQSNIFMNLSQVFLIKRLKKMVKRGIISLSENKEVKK